MQYAIAVLLLWNSDEFSAESVYGFTDLLSLSAWEASL